MYFKIRKRLLNNSYFKVLRIFSAKIKVSVERVNLYESILRLRIRNWSKEDEAHYSCFSTNSLGKADGRIQTYSEFSIGI